MSGRHYLAILTISSSAGYSQVVNYRGDYIEFPFAKADYGWSNRCVGGWRVWRLCDASQTSGGSSLSNRFGFSWDSVGKDCGYGNGKCHYDSGTVTKVNGNSITMVSADDSTIMVSLGDETSIGRRKTQAAKSIVVGDQISVRGVTGDDGSIAVTAATLGDVEPSAIPAGLIGGATGTGGFGAPSAGAAGGKAAGGAGGTPGAPGTPGVRPTLDAKTQAAFEACQKEVGANG